MDFTATKAMHVLLLCASVMSICRPTHKTMEVFFSFPHIQNLTAYVYSFCHLLAIAKKPTPKVQFKSNAILRSDW